MGASTPLREKHARFRRSLPSHSHYRDSIWDRPYLASVQPLLLRSRTSQTTHESNSTHRKTKTDKMHFAINTLVLATLAASQAYAASISHQHSAFHSHARKHNHVEQRRATALADSDASKLSALGVASLGVKGRSLQGQHAKQCRRRHRARLLGRCRLLDQCRPAYHHRIDRRWLFAHRVLRRRRIRRLHGYLRRHEARQWPSLEHMDGVHLWRLRCRRCQP